MRPDFGGGGLVNLVATLERSFGSPSAHPGVHPGAPGLEALLSSHRTVVLLLVDGMGECRLAADMPSLLRHQSTGLTSVFPSATAPAVTTLMTAAPPAQHGVPGWHFALEQGPVLTFLPYRMRTGGPPPAASPLSLLGVTPLSARLSEVGARMTVISPRQISESRVSRAFGATAQRIGFGHLEGMLDAITSAASSDGPRHYVYAYWSELDALSHLHGTHAPTTRAHLRQLAAAIETLRQRLAALDAVLLVTADHGFIDVGRVHCLSDHPTLRACLRAPLCGEPRLAICHLQPGTKPAFVDYVQRELDEALCCVDPEEALGSGLFGPAPADPRFVRRLGDVMLMARGRDVVVDRLPGEGPFRQIGVHGGATEEEMRVPLLVFGD